jgi:uncharacterized protein (TIGR02271 family)
MGPLSTQPLMDPRPTDSSGTTIPVTEEHVEVGRRTVDTGRTVRVRKHVHQEPVQAQVAVARDTADVERVPVGRVVAQAPPVRQEGDVTVVPVIEERLVTRKELVLVEEIRIGRRREVVQAREDLTLRRERVVVERFDPDTGQWLSEES